MRQFFTLSYAVGAGLFGAGVAVLANKKNQDHCHKQQETRPITPVVEKHDKSEVRQFDPQFDKKQLNTYIGHFKRQAKQNCRKNNAILLEDSEHDGKNISIVLSMVNNQLNVKPLQPQGYLFQYQISLLKDAGLFDAVSEDNSISSHQQYAERSDLFQRMFCFITDPYDRHVQNVICNAERLSATDAEELARVAIDHANAESLNVLARYFPEIINDQFVDEYSQHACDNLERLNRSLKDLEKNARLAPSLKNIFVGNKRYGLGLD